MSPDSNTTDYDESDATTGTSSHCYSSHSRRSRIQKRCAAIDLPNHFDNSESVQQLLARDFSSKYDEKQNAKVPILSTDVDQYKAAAVRARSNALFNKEPKTRPDTVNGPDNKELQRSSSQRSKNRRMHKSSSHGLKNPNAIPNISSHQTKDDLRKSSSHSNKNKDMQKSSSQKSKNKNKIDTSSHSKAENTNKSRKSSSMSTKLTPDSSNTPSNREDTMSNSKRRDMSRESRKEPNGHRTGDKQGKSTQRPNANTPGKTPAYRSRTLGEDSILRSPEKGTKRSLEEKQNLIQESVLRSPMKRSKSSAAGSNMEPEARQTNFLSDERAPRTSEKLTKKSVVNGGRERGDDDRCRNHSSRVSRSTREKRSVKEHGATALADHARAKATKTLKKQSKVHTQLDPSITPRRNHIKRDDLPRCPKRSPTLSPKKSKPRGRLQERSNRHNSNDRSRSLLRKPSMQHLSVSLTPANKMLQLSTEAMSTFNSDSCSYAADTTMAYFDPPRPNKGICLEKNEEKAMKSESDKMRRKGSTKTRNITSTKNKKESSISVPDENEFSDFGNASTSRRRKESRSKRTEHGMSTRHNTSDDAMNDSGRLHGNLKDHLACNSVAPNNITQSVSEVEQTPRRKALTERLDFTQYFRNSARRESKRQYFGSDEGYDSEASSCSCASSVSKRSLFGITLSHHLLVGGGHSDSNIRYK